MAKEVWQSWHQDYHGYSYIAEAIQVVKVWDMASMEN